MKTNVTIGDEEILREYERLTPNGEDSWDVLPLIIDKFHPLEECTGKPEFYRLVYETWDLIQTYINYTHTETPTLLDPTIGIESFLKSDR